MIQPQLHVIVGLGITGFACARYLKNKGIPIAITDTRASPPFLDPVRKQYQDVPISLGQFDEHLLDQAETIVLSPGISLREPAILKQIQRGKLIVGDIELFAQATKSPVIAITGTNAKSTVTTLIREMVAANGYSVQAGGNLGMSALDLLDFQPEVFVLELSSFQLEVTRSLSPQVATVLNLTEDHMDRYDHFLDYCRAKHRIYANCHIAVCNRDDPFTDTANDKKICFSLQKPGKNEFGLLKTKDRTYLAFEDQRLLAVDELAIRGRHYQANALAALAIGYAFGLRMLPMLNVLREFKGLAHRCQFVRELNGVNWYNDSKGTNVGATCAAISGLSDSIAGKIILIAGGVGKNANFQPLLPIVNQHVRHVILIGEATPEIAKALRSSLVTVTQAKTLEEAVCCAKVSAQSQDCVLLSPACASFDLFKNYEHRGDVFMNLVNTLD